MTPGYSADDVQQKIEKGYTTAARILDANGNDGAWRPNRWSFVFEGRDETLQIGVGDSTVLRFFSK